MSDVTQLSVCMILFFCQRVRSESGEHLEDGCIKFKAIYRFIVSGVIQHMDWKECWWGVCVCVCMCVTAVPQA